MITFEIIGTRIKHRREEIKISQQELADLLIEKGLKMSRETISKIESGSRATNAIEIKAICGFLSILSEDIMREDEEDDLVGLFRSREKISDEAMMEIEEIQSFIKDIIAQKKINDGSLTLSKQDLHGEVS